MSINNLHSHQPVQVLEGSVSCGEHRLACKSARKGKNNELACFQRPYVNKCVDIQALLRIELKHIPYTCEKSGVYE